MNKLKNFKMFLESTSEVNTSISEVIELINDNMNSGWKGSELEGSFECVILEDVEHTHDDADGTVDVYNGWYEKLLELQYFYPELPEIIELINDNKEDLWDHGLDFTFSCVITEDIDLDEDESYTNIYNGWYEKLQSLA